MEEARRVYEESRQYAERVRNDSTLPAGALALEPPTEEDIEEFLGSVDEDVLQLQKGAEELTYALHLQRLPHQWLTEALLWEAEQVVDSASRPWYFGSVVPEIRPAWRQDDTDPPRKVDLTVVIYADENEETARGKLDEAKKTLKEIRRRHPGPTQKPPADDELVRLLYRSLKGESYRDLASDLSEDYSVHYKTLARYLRQVRGIVFSPEE